MPYVPGMGKRETIRVPLDVDLIKEIDKLAAEFGCSRDKLVGAAIQRFVSEESPLDDFWASLPNPPPEPGLEVLDEAAEALNAFIQEGIDSAEREELIDHEDVIAELKRRRRKHAA